MEMTLSVLFVCGYEIYYDLIFNVNFFTMILYSMWTFKLIDLEMEAGLNVLFGSEKAGK